MRYSTQCNDTQQNNKIATLSQTFAYAECFNGECHCGECHFAECCGANIGFILFSEKQFECYDECHSGECCGAIIGFVLFSEKTI
jgi:hypothetical protein